MSSPPSQRQRQTSPASDAAANVAAAQAALAGAAAMKQASSAGVVRICGTSPSECGYCKGSRSRSNEQGEGAASSTTTTSSQSYSLLGDFMTPQTYEGFLYRGWRRSGTYLYKPNNWQSCCPALTIRLPVAEFVPTKSQRKVAKKMEQILQPPGTTTRNSNSGHGNNNSSPMPAAAAGAGGKRKHSRKQKQLSSEEEQTMDERLEQSSILQQLQSWTQPILQSLLESNANLKAASQQHPLKVEPTFKVKPLPPVKKSKTKVKQPATPLPSSTTTATTATTTTTSEHTTTTSTTATTNTITVCTTICAALAGRSKGMIQRDNLSQQLTQHLQSTYGNGKAHPLATTMTTSSPSSTSSSWILKKVHRHAKSGQVFCDIQLPPPQLSSTTIINGNITNVGTINSNNNPSTTACDDASMHDVSSSQTTRAPSGGPDKLQEWLDEHAPSMAPFCQVAAAAAAEADIPGGTTSSLPSSSSTTTTTPENGYPFVVKTLPAHQSALDPEVHKLYFLYQHKVHQDTDPFSCDLNSSDANSNSNNTSSSGSMNAVAAPDDGSGLAAEDDEWSTPATSDGNDVAPLMMNAATAGSSTTSTGSNGKLSPPPPPPPPPSTTTTTPAPAGFIDQAKRMLQGEYAHLSYDRLKQITKSYGSFFQFLIESPFKLLDPTTSTAIITQTPPSNGAGSTTKAAPLVSLPCGTYHQQYRVAGMLVAVGVVDILPRGLSSVYLFYHPHFARDLVPLGKYAILQEIEFARSLRIPYYYLGYYIESCTKMRYKAEYRPSELLCPTTYRWVDAILAQGIIQSFSPIRHCCTLYYSDRIQLEQDLKDPKMNQDSKEAVRNGLYGTTSSQSSSAGDDEESDDEDADDMSMDGIAPHAKPSSSSSGMSSKSAPARSLSSSSTRSTTKSILKKSTPFSPNPHVEQVKMDVGVGMPVTLSMLHERGRDTVRPLLEDFVKEAGPELSQKCLVKFS